MPNMGRTLEKREIKSWTWNDWLMNVVFIWASIWFCVKTGWHRIRFDYVMCMASLILLSSHQRMIRNSKFWAFANGRLMASLALGASNKVPRSAQYYYLKLLQTECIKRELENLSRSNVVVEWRVKWKMALASYASLIFINGYMKHWEYSQVM
jgi:hypothetical protein